MENLIKARKNVLSGGILGLACVKGINITRRSGQEKLFVASSCSCQGRGEETDVIVMAFCRCRALPRTPVELQSDQSHVIGMFRRVFPLAKASDSCSREVGQRKK